MNKALMRIVFVFFILVGLSYSAKSQCGEMNNVYMKELLGDAVYDNFRRTEIKNSENPYDVEFRVDLLKNFVYKLVFDMTDKSEGVVIKLYDLGPKKKEEIEDPELIYSSSEDVLDENATFDITFEAPKTRMLIKYEVKDATYEGCITFMLGVFLRENKPKQPELEISN